MKRRAWVLRGLVAGALLACHSCSNPASKTDEEMGYLYVVNRSDYIITLESVAIDGTPVVATWILRGGQYAALSVEPEEPSNIRLYPSGTVISFNYAWTVNNQSFSPTTGTTLNGTKTIKLREDTLVPGFVVFEIEDGDTRNQP